MRFFLFVTALVVCIVSVNAQFGVIMTNLGTFASTLLKVVDFLKDPVDRPMKLVSERVVGGNIDLVTVKPDHYNMNINFMIDRSNNEAAVMTALMQQISAGKSLREMETHLQSVDSPNKYTTTYFVPSGLRYYSGQCNRKFVKFCDFTYDMYIGIGQSKGWGWNANELKKISQPIVNNSKKCSYDRYCPAN